MTALDPGGAPRPQGDLPAEDAVELAAEVLERGGLVAFPTETVYGLGADAENPDAARRIFEVKGRPPDHPLIVHIGAPDQLDAWASQVTAPARRLAEACWPGPLTLVLPRRPRVPDVVTGGGATVGLRVPAHPVALALLEAFAARRPDGGAIAAPSANRFGRVSPTSAAHVRADLGDAVDLVLDGGRSQVGVESTIVDCQGPVPEVLRLGGVSVERLAEVLGAPLVLAPQVQAGADPDLGGGSPVRASGMTAAHYAPAARVELADHDGAAVDRANRLAAAGRVVAVLAPGVLAGLEPGVIELEPAGPAPDYARVLYDRLRQADRLGATDLVAVVPPPGGLGDAIRDRLARAAHQAGPKGAPPTPV